MSAIKGAEGIAGLPERIKCVREIRQLTQAGLADKLGCHVTHVSHWETGTQTPNAANLRALSIALNASVDYLLDCQED